MLIGYVSDERHVALDDARVAFRRDGHLEAAVRSTPDGAVHADLDPDEYDVTIAKSGYGPKRTTVTVGPGRAPRRFRLLSTRLYGYVSPLWVRAGRTATYRISAPEETRVSLWRYGAEKEFVRLLDWHGEHGPDACVQTLPDGDFTTVGLDWRSKNPSSDAHVETVTAPGESGLYYVHLTAKESREFFSFPWVVAPAEPEADLAVLAATMTWNAYNNFGGRSNYVNPDSLPTEPVVNARDELRRYREDESPYDPENHEYEPLSFDRPSLQTHVPEDVAVTDPIEGRNESHLAPAEWRFLGWLEREGYDYDLYADNQLHDGTLDLDAYGALAVHTHPEYWSERMYRRVNAWVHERGGDLLYLGGNGINCEVEVVDGTRVRYLNHDADVSNARADAENGYESRFDATVESEANLLGVVFTGAGIMTAAPYEVVDADHWVFERTDLEAGDTFGEESLQERCAGGASGHETDKRSASSPDDTRLLARGRNPDGGGAEMVSYGTDAGGRVFSVGSITWTPSLLVDADTAAITATVLDRFLDA